MRRFRFRTWRPAGAATTRQSSCTRSAHAVLPIRETVEQLRQRLVRNDIIDGVTWAYSRTLHRDEEVFGERSWSRVCAAGESAKPIAALTT